MATNVRAQDLRWHTNALTLMAMNTAGQNDSVQPGSNVLSERFAPKCVFQKSCIPSGHDHGLCLDHDMDNGAYREFAESACNPSIICLNANTNGTVVKDMQAVTTRRITEEAGFGVLSEGQTEIQLDAVGLSLSNSGMHLYVKADTDEKKKLLADTYVQLTAKPIKDKICKHLNLRTLLATTSDEAEREGYYHEVNRKSSQDNATYRKDMPRYEKPAVKVLGTTDQSVEQSSLLNHPSQARGACTHTSRGCTHCKETYASVHMTLPAREEINRQISSKKSMHTLDKFDSQEMVVNNKEDYRRDLTYQNRRQNYQRTHLHTFDTLKRQHAEETGENHQEKRSKYTDSQIHRKKQLILLHNQNYSSNNDDYIAYGTGSGNRRHGTKMKMMTSPVPCQREDGNHGTCVRHNELTCNAASIQTVTEPADDIQSKSLALTTKVPPTMLFPNPTHFNSAAYDGVSMSNFIDYANNIRKNIKEDYKNLSNLIKEFSDGMQERNNNHSSQSGSDKHKMDRKTSSENCVLM